MQPPFWVFIAQTYSSAVLAEDTSLLYESAQWIQRCALNEGKGHDSLFLM